ncbi:MAG: GNAT family N-acetyltransferase [Acidimicrobiia bacterium]|nr:GNAT family N-acetyltransferase [Acidimicrobiia bacterium]
MSEHIRRLERVGHAAWPSLEDEWLNGWLLRAGGGVTRRSNSANPVNDSWDDLETQIDSTEAWFAQRGLPAIARLTGTADPEIDRRLEARGYERDLGAVIMTRPVAGLAPIGIHGIDLADEPSPEWLEAAGREPGRGGAKRTILEKLLDRIDRPTAYARVGVDAIGLGVLVDDHLAVFMMRTEPHARRQGLARAIAGSVSAWGADRGATEAFLQVHPENAPAIALYESLGFERQYEYWYREKSFLVPSS